MIKLSWYPPYIGEEASKRLLDLFLPMLTLEAREKYSPERIMADVLWIDPGDLVGGYEGIKEYLRVIQGSTTSTMSRPGAPECGRGWGPDLSKNRTRIGRI